MRESNHFTRIAFLVRPGRVNVLWRVQNNTVRRLEIAARSACNARKGPINHPSWRLARWDKALLREYPLTRFIRRSYPSDTFLWAPPAEPKRGEEASSYFYTKEEFIWWRRYETSSLQPRESRTAPDNGTPTGNPFVAGEDSSGLLAGCSEHPQSTEKPTKLVAETH